MTSSTIKTAVVAACVFAIAGCAKSDPPDAANLTNKPSKRIAKTQSDRAAAPVFANKIDSAPLRVRVVRLDVHRLVVPIGAISRSDEFWKHVDEQLIDLGTYDQLRKNGIRLGVAPANEWGYFRDIVSAHPASSKRTVSAGTNGGAGAMELPMKEKVDYQNIFYFA